MHLVLCLIVHVVAAVFWAGSTFAMAMPGGQGTQILVRSQILAGLVATTTGASLWKTLHGSAFDTAETILATGAAAGLIALLLQLALALPVRRWAPHTPAAATGGSRRVPTVHRLAAALLLVALICMAPARFL